MPCILSSEEDVNMQCVSMLGTEQVDATKVITNFVEGWAQKHARTISTKGREIIGLGYSLCAQVAG
jgi:hypothetical protein